MRYVRASTDNTGDEVLLEPLHREPATRCPREQLPEALDILPARDRQAVRREAARLIAVARRQGGLQDPSEGNPPRPRLPSPRPCWQG
jgi:hypothetical protein